MKKILIVDDSATLRKQLREALERGGYAVVEAKDGLTGCAAAKSHADIKLIITDLNMPAMSGMAMIADIRKMHGYSKIPILMLTTEATQEMKKAGKSAGVLAWIVKPFVENKLIPAIHGILQMP